MSNGPGQNNLGTFQTGRSFAEQLDANDPLASMRERFELPRREDGTPISYLCGNSLGLMPSSAKAVVNQELTDWSTLAVKDTSRRPAPGMPTTNSSGRPAPDLSGQDRARS